VFIDWQVVQICQFILGWLHKMANIIAGSLVAVVIAIVFYILVLKSDQETDTFAMTTNQSLARCADKTAFVTGYTGEVGKEIVREILEKKIFKKVVLIGRRHVTYDDPLYDGVEQKIIDFDHLENHKDAFENIEYGFSCLGTTRRIAGADGFFKIEHDYTVNSAKLAYDMGCKRFSVVSAQAVNKDSYFLYPQTKGLADFHVSEIPFDKIAIARPGLLLSKRNNDRMVEWIATLLLKPIIYLKPTLISIPTTKVAKAIIFNMCADPIEQTVEILSNEQLHHIADNFYDKANFLQ